jgi:hypothetical protein
MNWRVVQASVAGTSHSRTSLACQDAHRAQIIRTPAGEEFLLAITADGAGSAIFGGEGASWACDQSMAEIVRFLSDSGSAETLDRTAITEIVSLARARISREAELQGCLLRDYACTLIGALVGAQDAWFFQCGDGAIIAGHDGIQGVVFWPDAGEYANMTYFITDEEWLTNLRIEHASCAFNEVAILTDGLQRLALSFQSQTVFRPFFDPMFLRLRFQVEADCEVLSEQLRLFLDSQSINERTDDDKTLVLAVR